MQRIKDHNESRRDRDIISHIKVIATALNEAGVSYDMEIYGGGLHSFTQWSSSDYDSDADLQSWAELLEFLPEIF